MVSRERSTHSLGNLPISIPVGMRNVLFFKHSMLASILYLSYKISEMKKESVCSNKGWRLPGAGAGSCGAPWGCGVGPGIRCGVGQSMMGALGQHTGHFPGDGDKDRLRPGRAEGP